MPVLQCAGLSGSIALRTTVPPYVFTRRSGRSAPDSPLHSLVGSTARPSACTPSPLPTLRHLVAIHVPSIPCPVRWREPPVVFRAPSYSAPEEQPSSWRPRPRPPSAVRRAAQSAHVLQCTYREDQNRATRLLCGSLRCLPFEFFTSLIKSHTDANNYIMMLKSRF